jgi:uncharacterized membrane protein
LRDILEAQVQLICMVYVAMGVLFVALGLPLMARRVPPNHWYGFRVPKTLKPGNERIWYDANAYSGRLMTWGGALTAVGAIALRFDGALSLDSYAYGCMGIMVAALVVVLILSLRYLASLK